MNNLLPFNRSEAPAPQPEVSFWADVRWPGLTASKNISSLLEEVSKRWAVFFYKKSGDFLWVLFLGGTGTGKSTLFNTLCGESLSETGVERPKTFGPILYAHQSVPLEKDFPFPSMEIRRVPREKLPSRAYAGGAGQLLMLEHAREDLAHLVLVDTPDVDSLEVRNRRMVEDLYLLSDVVVFVTSQEKYADEVPFQFFRRIHREGKPYFFLLNKASYILTWDEVVASFNDQTLHIREDRSWILPYVASQPAKSLGEQSEFKNFRGVFFRTLDRKSRLKLVRKEQKKRAQELKEQMHRLLEILEDEKRAAEKWRGELELLFQTTCRNLLQQQEERFSAESREYLQAEIRKLFGRYDVLATPRRVISQVALAPLRLLGLWSPQTREAAHKEALKRIRARVDLTPIQSAIESFNRAVLENLCPADATSPLARKLRERDILLTDDEIRRHVLQEQEDLIMWLEETFEQLARGIPKSKEWGIYSTSILWGALILSFEAALGGGISFLEAALDSALAPFVTKGAVELFAYHEIQKVGQQLARRYQEGLLSVVRRQRDRYVESLQSLMTSQETMAAIRRQWALVRSEQ